jgi:hypothetical protein
MDRHVGPCARGADPSRRRQAKGRPPGLGRRARRVHRRLLATDLGGALLANTATRSRPPRPERARGGITPTSPPTGRPHRRHAARPLRDSHHAQRAPRRTPPIESLDLGQAKWRIRSGMAQPLHKVAELLWRQLGMSGPEEHDLSRLASRSHVLHPALDADPLERSAPSQLAAPVDVPENGLDSLLVASRVSSLTSSWPSSNTRIASRPPSPPVRRGRAATSRSMSGLLPSIVTIQLARHARIRRRAHGPHVVPDARRNCRGRAYDSGHCEVRRAATWPPHM